MKYIVYSGSDTFEALSALKARVEASNAQLHTLLATYNTTRYAADPRCLAGGIVGIGLPQKPDGWRIASGMTNRDAVYYPKKIPANQALRDTIDAIPLIRMDEANQIVGFVPQWVGLKKLNGVGIKWGDGFHLIEINDEAEYSRRPDMEELLVSEWKRLATQLADEQEA